MLSCLRMKNITYVHVAIATILALGTGAVIGFAVGYDIGWERAMPADQPTQRITSFKECAAAGNPVMESYPRQCRANGQLFVEEIDEPIVPPDDRPMPVEPDGSIGDGAMGCVPAGCSGTICAELSEAANIVTTCEYRAEYACYKLTKCERQADETCGWTQTAEFAACLSNPPPIE